MVEGGNCTFSAYWKKTFTVLIMNLQFFSLKRKKSDVQFPEHFPRRSNLKRRTVLATEAIQISCETQVGFSCNEGKYSFGTRRPDIYRSWLMADFNLERNNTIQLLEMSQNQYFGKSAHTHWVYSMVFHCCQWVVEIWSMHREYMIWLHRACSHDWRIICPNLTCIYD